MATATIAPLHALLHRAAPAATTPADAPIASCLDAYLPVYSFPSAGAAPSARATLVDTVAMDEVPAVPDRDDDDASSLSLYEPDFGMVPCAAGFGDYFNALPLEVSKPRASLDAAPGGRSLPRRNASDVVLSVRGGGGGEVPCRSLLECALMVAWDDRAERGLFRYDVSRCPTRVLPGAWGFVAQLNEGRATKKRPTEFAVDRVMQPFDRSKFNFTKASVAEVLAAFQPAAAAAAEPRVVPPSAPLAAALAHVAAGSSGGRGGAGAGADPHLVLINVSPIDYGHVLLVPRVLRELPQALDARSVLLALQFARELGSAAFRVGYNSLGAYATINHLHFQSYYLPLELPVERAATQPLPGDLAWPATALAAAPAALGKRRRGQGEGGVHVSRLLGYPVNAFVVEAAAAAGSEADAGAGDGLEAVAAAVGAAAERMQAANQPFNLLVADAGRRVFVFPQCFAERQAAGAVPAELLDCGVNPACFEIAGHLLLKRAEDYAAASPEWACRLLAQASLPEERFMEVARMCFGGDGGDMCVPAGAAW